MKQELNNSKVYLDESDLNNLLTEVKETVAIDVDLKNKNKNTLSAADLWNIQRMKRQYQRRSTLWS